MAFLKKALRRAEDILESMDEKVANASRHLTIDGGVLTGDADRDITAEELAVEGVMQSWGDRRGAGGILTAESRVESSANLMESSTGPVGEGEDESGVEAEEDRMDADELQHSSEKLEVVPAQDQGVETEEGDLPNADGEERIAEDDPEAIAAAVSIVAPSSHAVDLNPELVVALREERDELRGELEMAEKELQVMSGALESLREKGRGSRYYEDEVFRLETELRNVSAQRRKIQQEKEDIERIQAEEEGIREDLQVKVNILQEELESVRESFRLAGEKDDKDVDGARREAIEAVLAHEQEIAAHSETRQKLQKRIEKLETEALSNIHAVAEAERGAGDARSLAKDAESLLSTKTRELDEARRKVRTLEEKISQMDLANRTEEELAATVAALDARVQGLEAEIEFKQAKILASSAEVQTLREALESSQRLSQRVEEPLAQGSSTIEHVQTQLRVMADSTMRLQSETEALRGENRALKHQLDVERRRAIEAQAIAAATSEGSAHPNPRMRDSRRSNVLPLRVPNHWPPVVIQVAEAIDSFTSSAVLFIRKEPLLRQVLFFYFLFMHFFIYALLHMRASSEHKPDQVRLGKFD